jgi:hypothetical protein
MPVASIRDSRFAKDYTTVMRVADQLSPAERNLIENAVATMFSVRSDYTDIKQARQTLATIMAKYSGA